jgi:pyocin large subunit-like protein
MDISSELPNAPEGTTTGDIFSGNELQLPEQDNIFGGTEIGELGNSSSSDFMGEEVDEMNLQMEFAKEMGIDNSNLTGVEADEFKANFEVWLNKKNGGK